MIMNRKTGSQGTGVAEMFEKMTGFPSPEKVLAEMQRLNNNLELIQPDLHKLANELDNIPRNEISNLSAALNKLDMGNTLKVLQEFDQLARIVYEKLWGK